MTLTAKQARKTKFELIGRITAGLAHEMSGPLGIAIGFTELAKDTLAAKSNGAVDAQTATKVSQYLVLIESSSKRARDLSRAISEFAKAKPGQVSEFDLRAVVSQAALISNPAVKSGMLEIIASADGPEVTVRADRAVTMQALVELFLSSMEAFPSGGTIGWEVRREGRKAQFVLTGEPTPEGKPQAWPVDEAVREAFESQGGSLSPAVSKALSGERGPGAAAHALIVTGTLPGVAG
jgi:signal transduction histidine kinase